MADVDKQNVAAGAAGNESVGSLDALTKVAQLHESGVIERLDLVKGVTIGKGKRQIANTPQCRTPWNQKEAWADASQ